MRMGLRTWNVSTTLAAENLRDARYRVSMLPYLGDVRTKPISIVGTERQQTVHSQVSRVLALCEIVRKAFRPGGFTAMAISSGFIIAEAEQCVIRIGVPAGWPRLPARPDQEWRDENCGTNGWAITPSGTRGVLNDAGSRFSRKTSIRAPDQRLNGISGRHLLRKTHRFRLFCV
jgi:hypothetical protein